MKRISTTKPLLTGLMATAFCIATAPAHASITLLDINFDGITSTSAAAVSSVLEQLPNGTQWSSTTAASAVNLRLGTDSINGYNPGNPLQRFALSSGTSFFLPATAANNFLVMGDDSGQLAGSPTAGTFGFALPFTLASGTTDITISFDWVFSAFLFGSPGDTDQFNVGVGGNGFNINSPLTTNYSVLNQSITNSGKVYGPANVNILAGNLGAPDDANGQYWLSFGYLENTSAATNGAIGVDNIKVTANVSAVPLPAAVWMFLSGFMGLLALSRSKQGIA